jgi:hypothetical protein
MEPLEKRQIELERQANASSIEAECLKFDVSDSKSFEIKDLETYQRIRGRFNRLKSETGRVYSTKIDGNNVIVRRSL